MKFHARLASLILTILTILPCAALAAKENQAQAFGISIENDSKNVGGPGADQAYSNGLKMFYVYARDHVPRWAPKSIIESSYLKNELQNSVVNFGVSLNHQIYTPNNTRTSGLERSDRPYAAWLNMAFALHLRSDRRSQSLELSLGIVGPSALGERVQNDFHRMIGSEPAVGWKNQLGDEPAVQISYQQRLALFELRNSRGTYADLIPLFGGGIGNILIGMHLGILARVGKNLPNDFGPSRPSGAESDSFVVPSELSSKPQTSSYFFFAAFRGNTVARNLFLDGNTIRPNSTHITKYPITAATEVGIGVEVFPIGIVWRYIVRSPDFEENSGFNSFASLSVTYFTK